MTDEVFLDELKAKNEQLVKRVGDYIAKGGFLTPYTYLPRNQRVKDLLAFGRELRDIQIWREPTLSGAVYVYQQLASSREWVVSGKPRPASRAVDFLHATRSTDSITGLYTEGFEEYLRRSALDYIAVGRIAYLNRLVSGQTYTRLEYLDPTELMFARKKKPNYPITAEEKVWSHKGEEFRYDQVFINHAIPMGTEGYFLAPLAPVVPSMSLAYLLRDHDTTSLDGRRVRELFLVGSDNVQEAIINAVLTQVALHAGVDPKEAGIPVVSLNLPSGTKVADAVATLMLSKLPENFDREAFMFEYVNQISAALGLALRHFWNNERTTNKALEEIQEQRQQQKGPAEFVKTKERSMNRSGILNQFGGRVRFGFIEEVDAQSQLTNAQVLKATAEALGLVAQTFGGTLSLDALLAWMQSIRVLPNELKLVEGEPQQALVQPDKPGQSEGETTSAGNPSPSALPDREKTKRSVPDYDQVTINSRGEIIDRRYKVFTAASYIAALEDAKAETEDLSFKSFEQVIAEENERIVDEYRRRAETNDLRRKEAIDLFSLDEVSRAMERVEAGETLDSMDYLVLSALLEEPELTDATGAEEG